MATFTNAQANYGLLATPTPERQNSNLQGSIGVPQQTANLGAKPIWTAGITFGATAQTITLNPLTAVLSGASAAVAASSQAEIVLNPTDGQTLTIDGITYTFKDTATTNLHLRIGVDATATRDNVVEDINLDSGHPSVVVSGSGGGAFLNFVAKVAGSAGNSIALSKSNDSTWSGFDATLSGGVDGVEYEVFEGDGTDCEGIDLPAADDNPAFLMTVSAGRVKATDGADFTVKPGAVSTTVPGWASLGADALSFDGDIVFTCDAMPASGPAEITVNLLLNPS
jgi:hypothetical protein